MGTLCNPRISVQETGSLVSFVYSKIKPLTRGVQNLRKDTGAFSEILLNVSFQMDNEEILTFHLMSEILSVP